MTDDILSDYDNTDWFLDDDSEEFANELPRHDEGLFALIVELTDSLLQREYAGAVWGDGVNYQEYEMNRRLHHALNALGKGADEAIEAGRERYAAGFTDEKDREIFLDGTALERDIQVTEAKLGYLRETLTEQSKRP